MVDSKKYMGIHNEAVIIDGHVDSAWMRTWPRHEGKTADLYTRDEKYQCDAERMIEGGMTAISFMVGDHYLDHCLLMFEYLYRCLDEHPEDTMKIGTVDDLHKCKQEGKAGFIPSLEGGVLLSGQIEVLHQLYRLGIRIMGFTHTWDPECEWRLQTRNSLNPHNLCTLQERIADRKEASGLNGFGLECLKVCNELGIVIDMAHMDDVAIRQVLEQSIHTPVFSHGNAFSLCRNWRNLTDDLLKGLAERGGVIGICFHPLFIDEEDRFNGSLEKLLDHVCYIADLIGPEHVGIGSDFDGITDTYTLPVSGVDRLPLFTEGLVKRGFSEPEVKGMLGENYIRVFKEVWR